MKQFDSRNVLKAIQYALDGGQSLHIWRGEWPDPKPSCFVNGQLWGHLIDQDVARLITTAKRLGVRNIVVANRGRRTQHVDLCGKPLTRAVKECEGSAAA